MTLERASQQPRLVMLVGNPCTHDSRVLRAANVARAAGFETIVVALGTGSEPAKEVKANGVIFRRFSLPPRRQAKSIKNVQLWFCQSRLEANSLKACLVDEVRGLSPDIIHAHDLITLPTGCAVARENGALLIYDAHELERHRHGRSGPFDRWLRGRMESRLIGKAHAVVTVSDSIARRLAVDYGIPLPAVVTNAPSENGVPHGVGDLRSDLGLDPNIPLAVYIGKITRGRGLDKTVRSLMHCPGWHLAMLGPSHASTLHDIRKLTTRLGLAERVHLVNPVPPACVTIYVRTADISVIPIQNSCLSYYYSLPNKLLESTMARLPVVVPEFPELVRFIQVSQSGIVMDETSPQGIASGMIEAYRRRDQLRPDDACLRRVSEIYGWPRQQQVLLTLYAQMRSLLTKRDNPRRDPLEKQVDAAFC